VWARTPGLRAGLSYDALSGREQNDALLAWLAVGRFELHLDDAEPLLAHSGLPEARDSFRSLMDDVDVAIGTMFESSACQEVAPGEP
jgi:hypothetical protein